MILGFAHITKNIDGRFAFGNGLGSPIASAPEKWPLMAERPTRHRLWFKDGPIETVEYETAPVIQMGRLGFLSRNIISITARDVRKESEWFCRGLGFECNPFGELQLVSRVPGWSVRIAIDSDAEAPIDPPLDISGFAALAFYSSDVEADRDHLMTHGGRTPTEPFTVNINDREMKIIMLRSPEGTIIELIQVMTSR